MKNKYAVLFILCGFILAVFLFRIVWAEKHASVHTFYLFESIAFLGAVVILGKHHSILRKSDWFVAILLGALIGAGMLFSSLFSPYPFFGLIKNNPGQAFLRGGFTAVAALGGLAIMRLGGPIQFSIANGNWKKAGSGALLGLGIGLPIAGLNIFALQLTQGQPLRWQNPLASMLDALQPAVVEEVIYRFALWGLLWLILRGPFQKQAAWLAGLLAMLIHNYAHFDDLLIQAPWLALGMGAVMALIWGLPPLILARRRGLEAAIAFHWVQDVARFLAGF